MGELYKVVDLESNKIVYIGVISKTTEQRWYWHCRNAPRNSIIDRKIRKYGKDRFEAIPLIISNDKNYLLEMERRAVISYNTKIPNGFNITDGGIGTLGRPHSQMTRNKLSMAAKKRAMTQEGINHLKSISALGIEASRNNDSYNKESRCKAISESRKRYWDKWRTDRGNREPLRDVIERHKNSLDPEIRAKREDAMKRAWIVRKAKKISAIAWTIGMFVSSMAAAQVRVPPLRTVVTLGVCTDADPKIVAVSDGLTNTDCVTGGGAFDVVCSCKDGKWQAQGSIASAAGDNISMTATAPAATTGASQAGKTVSITASPAVASTDTNGAAAGGSVTITAGNAARLTSGNAKGGDINLTPGSGIGTGGNGDVVLGGTVPRLTLFNGSAGSSSVIRSIGSAGDWVSWQWGANTLSLGSGAAISRKILFDVSTAGGYLLANSKGFLGWTDTADPADLTVVTVLGRDANHIIAQRNGANAQTYRLYGTYTDASNNEYAELSTQAGTGITLAAKTNGTGADNLSIILQPAGTGTVQAYGQGSYPDDNVQIGSGSVAKSDDADDQGSVAIGQQASANKRLSVAIGRQAAANSIVSVALGSGSSAAHDYSTAIGSGANSTNHDATAVGYAAQAGLYGSAFGNETQATGDHSLALGRNARTTYAGSIALGGKSAPTAANQLALGSSFANGYYISSAYLGSGVTDASPVSIVLNATGGSGTDVAGASLTLAGGKGTGTGAPGSVIIQTSTAGTTGTTLQTLATRATFSSTSATIAVPLLSQVYVSPQASTPVTVASTDSGKLYTDEGASAQIVYNLPTAVAGQCYEFAVQSTYGIKIVANAGDTIRLLGTVSAAAGYIQSTTQGSTLRLCAINATEFFGMSALGTWSIDS